MVKYPAIVKTDKQKRLYRDIYDEDNSDEDNLYNYINAAYESNLETLSKYYKKAEKAYNNFEKELARMDREAQTMMEIRKVAIERKKFKELNKLEWIIQYINDKFNIDLVELVMDLEDQDDWIERHLNASSSGRLSSPAGSPGSPFDTREYYDEIRVAMQAAGHRKVKKASPPKKSQLEIIKEMTDRKIEKIREYIFSLTPRNFDQKFFNLSILLNDLIGFMETLKQDKHTAMVYDARIIELVNDILMKLENFQMGPRNSQLTKANAQRLIDLFKGLGVDVELEQTMNTDYDTIIANILSQYNKQARLDAIRRAIIQTPDIVIFLHEIPELDQDLRELGI